MSKLFFEIIPNNANIDFMKKAKGMIVLGATLVGISLVSLATRGLNYGVDFEGGTQIHLKFQEKASASAIRDALEKINLEEAAVQEIGEGKQAEFLVRVPALAIDFRKHQAALQKALDAAAPADGGQARLKFSEDRLYVQYASVADAEKIRAAIQGLKIADLDVHSVEPFGRAADHEYRVQMSGVASRILGVLETRFGKNRFEVLQVEYVGPKVGKELRMQAIGAVLISLLLILIYVWFRFEFEFAPGGIICLFHDAMIILGVFSIFQLTFDLSIVAAVLTIIGFSINDTIVIYDRIRENIQRTRNPDMGVIINDSINQTLSRTILTSGTVIMASVALLVFGGPITFNFALAFTIGLVAGSYSTISIAAPLTMYLHNYMIARKKAA